MEANYQAVTQAMIGDNSAQKIQVEYEKLYKMLN